MRRHRGAAGATGKLTALLDRSRGALVCCVPIDLRGADAPRTSLLCLVLPLVKRNMKRIQ